VINLYSPASITLTKELKMQEQIVRWLDAKEKLKMYQDMERKLREDILHASFGDNNIGSLNCINGGYLIKGSYGTSFSIDQKGIKDAIESGEIGDAICAVRTKYELDKKAYDSLDDDALEIINEFVTQKPSLPTLEIKLNECDDNE
jgi:hypothetical protein